MPRPSDDRPLCMGCGRPLPLRTVAVLAKDCWSCETAVTVAIGSRDSGHLYPAEFTDSELAFARSHGVILEVRHSATVGGRYLTNVCAACDKIQGNWFLYQDPLHDTYRIPIAESQGYDGPCDKCSERHCELHGEYRDYDADGQCPTCLEVANLTPCQHQEGRECYYPDTCEEHGCYFARRDEARRREKLEREVKEAETAQQATESIEEETAPLQARIRGCTYCGASRRHLRSDGEGHVVCTECGGIQEPGHFRM